MNSSNQAKPPDKSGVVEILRRAREREDRLRAAAPPPTSSGPCDQPTDIETIHATRGQLFVLGWLAYIGLFTLWGLFGLAAKALGAEGDGLLAIFLAPIPIFLFVKVWREMVHPRPGRRRRNPQPEIRNPRS